MRPTSVPRSARPRFPTTPLRVLHIAMEVDPWSALGDVGPWVSGLAGAQAEAGDRVTVVTPLHGDGRWPLSGLRQVVGSGATLRLGELKVPFSLRRLRHPHGFEVVAVDCALFERAGIYAHPDSGELHSDTLLRASVLCHAALYYALNAGGRWQVLHGHDHHGALAMALLRGRFQPTPLQHARSVLTIHDPARLGMHPPEEAPLAGLPRDAVAAGDFAYEGSLSTLRAGLRTADAVHCVASAHQRLLTTTGQQGHPLSADTPEALGTVPGGVDAARWDPSSDPALAASFSTDDPSGRAACRQDLLGLCGWADDGPLLLGYAGPVLPERGLVEVARALASTDLRARMVVSGAGDGDTLDQLRGLADPRVVILDAEGTTQRQVLAGLDVHLLAGEDCGGDLSHGPACRYGAAVLVREGGGPDRLPEGARWLLGAQEDLVEGLRRLVASPPGPEASAAALAINAPWHEAAQAIRRRFYLQTTP